MALRNFAEATRRGYAADLRHSLAYLAATFGIESVSEVQRFHLHYYLAELDTRNRAGATRARKMAAIKSFFGYLEDIGVISVNPARGIPRPKQEVHEPRVLTEAEYKRLQEACQGHQRDRAIMELFLQTGLRLSEVAHLALIDVQVPTGGSLNSIGAVRVKGKGRKQRSVTLNWKACQAIAAYLTERPATGCPNLFLSKNGSSLSGRAIQRIVKKYMAKGEIVHATVHTLRHTFATHMVRKGTNLRVIQEALGHTSLQTTSRYISLARELMDEQLQANAL
jgi:site-specific recombinase XerD